MADKRNTKNNVLKTCSTITGKLLIIVKFCKHLKDRCNLIYALVSRKDFDTITFTIVIRIHMVHIILVPKILPGHIIGIKQSTSVFNV